MKKTLLSLIILTLFTLGFSDDRMNYEEEYLPRLQRAQEELARLESEISKEEGDIESHKEQISNAEKEIENIWNEIYAAIGSDKNGVDAYRRQLNDLETSVRNFGALPAEELYRRRSELDRFEGELNEMRANNVSALTEFVNKIQMIDQRIKSIRSSIVVPYVTSYMVRRGDSLWKISGKKDIYDDPFKWTDIYRANQQTIRNWQRRYNAVLKEGQQEADLIYPDQEFTIPR